MAALAGGLLCQPSVVRAINEQTASVPETTPSDEDVWAFAVKPVMNANTANSHFVASFWLCVIAQ